jgi:hypothetical protein
LAPHFDDSAGMLPKLYQADRSDLIGNLTLKEMAVFQGIHPGQISLRGFRYKVFPVSLPNQSYGLVRSSEKIA